jgi:hypothetical protein
MGYSFCGIEFNGWQMYVFPVLCGLLCVGLLYAARYVVFSNRKLKTKEAIFMIAWVAVYITALHFLMFKFGIFTISAAWVLAGIPLFWLFQRLTSQNQIKSIPMT